MNRAKGIFCFQFSIFSVRLFDVLGRKMSAKLIDFLRHTPKSNKKSFLSLPILVPLIMASFSIIYYLSIQLFIYCYTPFTSLTVRITISIRFMKITRFNKTVYSIQSIEVRLVRECVKEGL